MATISENLQTIKSSTEAIKQAIIDKGGTISGDITTWADAISGLSGGGSAEEYVFTGTVSYSGSIITLTGQLSSKPELSPIFLVLVYLGPEAVASKTFVSDISDTLTVTIDAKEPLFGNEIPVICLMHQGSGKSFPVTFIQQTPDQITNQITYTNAGCTAQYPVASELTINITGRKTTDAASSAPSTFDIYIPEGETASTATRTIFGINSITPSEDSTYIYTY